MKPKNYFISGIIFILLIGCGILVVQLIESKQIIEKKIIASDLLASAALTIKNQIDRPLSSTYGLAIIIKENNGEIKNFEDIAKSLIQTFNGIESLNVAPDAIVKNVFPLEDKEQLIGINLLKINERKEDILKAIKDKKLTLGGPYNLFEGGKGLMGRLPVFLGKDNQGKFWGLVNVTISFDYFLNSSGLNDLNKSGYLYKLYWIDETTNEEVIINDSTKGILKDPVDIKIHLPNTDWYMSLVPKNGWISYNLIIIMYILVISLSAIISAFVFFALAQPDILKEKIKIATFELAEKHRKLEDETNKRKENEKLLHQAEKLASLGKLTSTIAHEIRQPLNSIKILTDGVLFWDEENQKVSYDELKGYFVNISKYVDKIEEIIKNLRLMINSPEKIEAKLCNINNIITETIKIYEQKLISNSIKLNLELDDNINDFYISERQFQQIIINLLDNSIHAFYNLEKNDKQIIIKSEDKENFIVLDFIDNGPGINDDIKSKIFDPFFTTKLEKESMGMGLYVVSNILKTFNSEINVFDNNTGGVIFEIILHKSK